MSVRGALPPFPPPPRGKERRGGGGGKESGERRGERGIYVYREEKKKILPIVL